MAVFTSPLDIGNSALRLCGASRIASFTEDSKNATSISGCYDEMRVAELRRNVWRFAIRRAVLRPLDDDTLTIVPVAYDPAKTYIFGALVSYLGVLYLARDNVPITTPPDANPTLWEQYFGPMTADAWDSTIAYDTGELVYSPAGTTYAVYMSLQSQNSDDPTAAPPAWDATVTYRKGDTVTYSAVVYQSTLDLNLNHIPTVSGWQVIPGTQPVQMRGQKWLRLNTTIRAITIPYPLGSGPRTDSRTSNVFRLPNGFLHLAPQTPKAGLRSFLGAPTGAAPLDWNLEGNYILSNGTDNIVLRFVADIADVTQMDPMFCSGLAARVALEVCEDLTQSDGKLQAIGSRYTKFMSEARTVNGIETGPTQPPEDDFILCRI